MLTDQDQLGIGRTVAYGAEHTKDEQERTHQDRAMSSAESNSGSGSGEGHVRPTMSSDAGRTTPSSTEISSSGTASGEGKSGSSHRKCARGGQAGPEVQTARQSRTEQIDSNSDSCSGEGHVRPTMSSDAGRTTPSSLARSPPGSGSGSSEGKSGSSPRKRARGGQAGQSRTDQTDSNSDNGSGDVHSEASSEEPMGLPLPVRPRWLRVNEQELMDAALAFMETACEKDAQASAKKLRANPEKRRLPASLQMALAPAAGDHSTGSGAFGAGASCDGSGWQGWAQSAPMHRQFPPTGAHGGPHGLQPAAFVDGIGTQQAYGAHGGPHGLQPGAFVDGVGTQHAFLSGQPFPAQGIVHPRPWGAGAVPSPAQPPPMEAGPWGARAAQLLPTMARKRASLDEVTVVRIFLAKHANPGARDTSLCRRLAHQYGVTDKAVRDIWNMRTWKHVTESYWMACAGNAGAGNAGASNAQKQI